MAAATVQGAGEEGIVCSLKYFALMKENLQEEIGEKMYAIRIIFLLGYPGCNIE